MSYEILIKYTTGDSHHSYDTEEVVGCIWQNKEAARAALKSIKEHTQAVDKYRTLRSKKEKDNFLLEIKTEEWFVKSKDLPDDMWRYTMLVKKDSGEFQQIEVFWQGYFETIHSAEIILSKDHEDLDKLIF